MIDWIGLCWGMNSNLYGKDEFPYKEAAVRSIKLWHKLTDARVVMTVVYSDSAPSPPKFCWNCIRFDCFDINVKYRICWSFKESWPALEQMYHLCHHQNSHVSSHHSWWDWLLITIILSSGMMTSSLLLMWMPSSWHQTSFNLWRTMQLFGSGSMS